MNYKWKLLLIAPLLLSFQGSNENLNSSWIEFNQSHQLNIKEQSYCVLKDGSPYGMNLDKRMKPASVSKLYTTFWALKTLGPYFRFPTKFFLENRTLYIESGHDPFFVTENLFLILNHLNSLGITELDEIKVTSHFYLNWSKNPNTIRKILLESFNTQNWSSYLKQTFKEMNLYLKRTGKTQFPALSFKVNKVSVEDFSLEKSSFIHYSSEIHQHLKQVNIYSNNFYSDELFSFLGGQNEFEDFILKELNESRSDIYFYTGSGLGDNYTTCNITLKLIQKLANEIENLGLKLEDIISVAGVDDGTLKTRFKTKNSKDKVIAKTGTLKDTSTLAGFLGVYHHPFVILNHSYNAKNAKDVQNKFVEKLIEEFDLSERLQYKKIDYLSIDDVRIE